MSVSDRRSIRVVVVDDERPAREELRRMMQRWDDVEVVGDAATLDDAREAIEARRPQVVLLDIQLQKRSGFELLGSLDTDIAVVFVTAYAKHAVRAFEVSAVDYLLKPVEPDRLRSALDRVRSQRLPPLGNEPLRAEDVFLVKNARRYHFVRVDEVRYVESQGEYTEVHAVQATGLCNRSLADWEGVLPGDRFVRIHRSMIVNLHFVTTMAPSDGSGYELTLKDSGERLAVSRRYAAKIRSRLI